MTDARIEAAVSEWVRQIDNIAVEKTGKAATRRGPETLSNIRKAMEAAIAAADAAAWIKISDKLPDDNQDVLVATYERIVTADTFNMDDEGGYFSITDDGDVTHWQPLPAPPTKEATP